jgi:hypothetical protein
VVHVIKGGELFDSGALMKSVENSIGPRDDTELDAW